MKKRGEIPTVYLSMYSEKAESWLSKKKEKKKINGGLDLTPCKVEYCLKDDWASISNNWYL